MWRLIVVTSLSLSFSLAAEAAGLSLQSHRAVYELELLNAREGGVTDLDGRLVMEWGQDCEGYILNQRMVTTVTNVRGRRAINDFQVTSWESVDGLKFRFSSRDSTNGTVTEEIDGKAELSAPGGAGLVRFRKPREAELPLPAGTVFPSEQAMLLIRAAQSGENNRNIILFDGSRVDGLYETFNVIGKEHPPMSASEAGGHELLAGQRSWHVHIAYFTHAPEAPDAGTPEFQVGYRLFQNGVATDIVLDYGAFSMGGELSQLEALPQPSC